MTVQPLINHVELSFWHKVIPLMQRSTLVKTLAPHFYQLSSTLWDVKPILIVYLCFMSGASFIFLLDLIN